MSRRNDKIKSRRNQSFLIDVNSLCDVDRREILNLVEFKNMIKKRIDQDKQKT